MPECLGLSLDLLIKSQEAKTLTITSYIIGISDCLNLLAFG